VDKLRKSVFGVQLRTLNPTMRVADMLARSD
jgi:hypothetical protein